MELETWQRLTDLAFIADAPTALAAPASGPPRSRIQVAELGSFSDPRYGRFKITQAEVDNWQRLLSAHFHGRVPIDIDHRTDKGVSSEAAAWIVGLDQSGKDGSAPTPNEVWATVEWTPLGQSAVEEKRYLYISPTYVSDLKDKAGKGLGPALLRAALTNNPFLHDMPAVSLSGATLAVRDTTDTGTAGPSDSRPAMTDFATIAKSLGLAEDADEATILSAAAALKAKADTAPPETKTLEVQASEQGKVILDAAQVVKLQADAAQGVAAAETLRVQTFEAAFTKALEAGKVDAKEETKNLHRGIYDAKPEDSLKLLESLPQIVSLTAKGRTGDLPGEAPDGVDPERYELHRSAEAYALEHNVDYMVALDRVREVNA